MKKTISSKFALVFFTILISTSCVVLNKDICSGKTLVQKRIDYLKILIDSNEKVNPICQVSIMFPNGTYYESLVFGTLISFENDNKFKIYDSLNNRTVELEKIRPRNCIIFGNSLQLKNPFEVEYVDGARIRQQIICNKASYADRDIKPIIVNPETTIECGIYETGRMKLGLNENGSYDLYIRYLSTKKDRKSQSTFIMISCGSWVSISGYLILNETNTGWTYKLPLVESNSFDAFGLPATYIHRASSPWFSDTIPKF